MVIIHGTHVVKSRFFTWCVRANGCEFHVKIQRVSIHWSPFSLYDRPRHVPSLSALFPCHHALVTIPAVWQPQLSLARPSFPTNSLPMFVLSTTDASPIDYHCGPFCHCKPLHHYMDQLPSQTIPHAATMGQLHVVTDQSSFHHRAPACYQHGSTASCRHD